VCVRVPRSFDGVDSCTCDDGYEERGGRCVPAAPAATAGRRGPAATGAAGGAAEGEGGVEVSEAEFAGLVASGEAFVAMFHAPW
jgi:hypothetical protein